MIEDEDPPFGISREDWQAMLAQVERKAAADRKRSETMKAKAAAAKAARLAVPAATVQEAWRRHAETCPFLHGSPDSSAWFRENERFEFDGTTWERRKTYQRSNSGKSRQVRSIVFYGEDGRIVTGLDAGPNRRNDEARDYGLPD